MTELFEKPLKNITNDDITDYFKFGAGLANAIKWSLIGLYVRNDKVQIEQLESMFKKSGALYDKRAYKTEAKAVYQALFDGVIPLTDENGEALTLSQLVDYKPDELETSVGMLYKSIPKKETNGGNVQKKRFKQLAELAVSSPNIETGGDDAKQLLRNMESSNPLIRAVVDDIFAQAEKEEQSQAFKEAIPQVTCDNVENIVAATKDYILELATSYPAEYQTIKDYILEIDAELAQGVAPAVEEEAA